MSRKHDLGYERVRVPVMRDDSENVRLAAEILNLQRRIDALNQQIGVVVAARKHCYERLAKKERRLSQIAEEES